MSKTKFIAFSILSAVMLAGVGVTAVAADAAKTDATAQSNLREQLKKNLSIEKFQLKNGLTVVLHRDDTIPMVSYQQWFRVGSSNEKPGRTGLAHFFEHLMFKGTKSISAPEYEQFINGNGGYNNAFTTRDYTGYYTLIPSDHLKRVIEIEADRMVHLNFDQKQIDSEREVVKEERRYRYENDPDGALYELLYETVFKVSPYRWPVIGYMRDLNAAKIDELRAFYKTYYAPNNATVVVAGKFNPSQVRGWIEDAYGKLQKQELPTFKPTPEPEQKAPRRAQLLMDVQAPKIVLAYPGPNAFSHDEYALQALSSLLAGGTSSRLYKKLVRQKQWATGVSADLMNGPLEGVFAVFVDLRTGVKVSSVVNLINKEIAALSKKAVSEDEFKRVRNSVMYNYTTALRTISGKARILAYSETVYKDPTKMFDDLEQYDKLSVDDLTKAAQTYLLPQRQSLVSVIPRAAKH